MERVIRGEVQADLLNGNGNGDGNGYGDGDYWLAVIPNYVPQDKLCAAKASGATIAFWRSDAHGAPCNGGRGESVTVGDVQEISGPLQLCRRAFHATLNPPMWNGARLWIVALHGEVVGNAEKYGALKREILAEVT